MAERLSDADAIRERPVGAQGSASAQASVSARAARPGAATCCAGADLVACCEPAAKGACCGSDRAAADPPRRCGCR